MKKIVQLFLVMSIICVGAFSSQAQFAQPYLMNEGIAAAKKIAADSGWKSPKLVSIVTLGDTTGLGQIVSLIGGVYDIKTGKSPIWIYVISALDKSDSVITKLLAMIKVPFLGFQQFPIPDGAGPGNIPFVPQDTIPSNVLNSDIIATKLKADMGFKTYNAKYPTAKPPFILVFSSPFELPGVNFPAGTPIWLFNFADPKTQEAVYDCYVNAINGEVICQAPLSMNETIIVQDDLNVSPNPVLHGNSAQLNIPVSKFDQHATISIANILGETVFSFNSVLNIGDKLQLPQFSPGSYFVRYTTQTGTVYTPFVQY
ncbi:hypothetical protein LBMAG36_05860 [Chlorobiota bacterium]|nr:hypothetical protein LBMAG36_05860 [Chlorobiota bacterium]